MMIWYKYSPQNSSKEDFLGEEGTTYLGKPLERACSLKGSGKGKLSAASCVYLLSGEDHHIYILHCSVLRVSRGIVWWKM